MPRYVVCLRRVGPAVCCGAVPSVRTAPLLGTVTAYRHSARCRVGRVLRGPAHCTRPGFEPAPLDDSKVVKR
jgi:hypothetical protein